MINHGRNLLLNISPQRMSAGVAGYEHVASDFVPFRFSDTLSVIHRVLFGAQPDNKFLNLRARELLNYIHETEFASYLYKFDSRITYWPRQETPEFLYAKKVTVTQVSGQARRLGVGGSFSASNTTGSAEKNFILDLSSTADAFVASLQPYGFNAGEPVNETFSAIDAAPILFAPDTGIRFSLSATSTTLTNRILTETGGMLVIESYDPFGYLLLEDDGGTTTLPFTAAPRMAATSGTLVARWLINMQANPSPAITTIMPTLELLGEPVFLDLFGVADAEPYTTFKNLWFDHPLPNYRLAGLTLAFIYRAEEQRLQNG